MFTFGKFGMIYIKQTANQALIVCLTLFNQSTIEGAISELILINKTNIGNQ